MLLKEKNSTFLIPLGIFNGIGQGFYYFSFNLLIGQFVKENEQGKFFSFQQTFSYIFGVVTPTLSGYIIVSFTKLTGYYILFSVAVCLFIIGMIITNKMNGMKLKQNIKVFEVLKLKHNIYWNTNKYYNFSNGVRESIFNQIFTVFAYMIVSNEQMIGQYNSLMAMIGIMSSTFIASYFHRSNQKKYHLIESIVYFLVMLFLGIFKSQFTLFLVYISLGIVYCWNQTIFQSMKYQLSEIAKNGYTQYEYIVSSEFFIALGRMTGLVFALVLCSVMSLRNAYGLLMIFDGSLLLMDHYIINKKVQWLTKEEL